MGYIFCYKENYNSEWHNLIEYEHSTILLQGKGGDKSIITCMHMR